MQIVTIETPSLGDRSYVVTDGELAAVIDPQRDLDRILAVTEARGLLIAYVLETHVHNDYVSGGFELARRVGATYVLNRDDELFFDFHGVGDGDELHVGRLVVRALLTPGHTPTHLSYAVTDLQADEGAVRRAVFTGGSLLYGTVGRTDLVSRGLTPELTRQQHRSAQRLAVSLPDDTAVLPTHGFGSFCSSVATDATADVDPTHGVELSTMGEQRAANLAITITDEDEFVDTLLSGLDAYPRYYVHMAPRNRVGPDGVNLSPPVEADPTTLLARMHAGEWVVDLRSRTAYAADHVVGTINVELADSFSTYLAWLIPWGVPVTLVGDTPDEVAEAQRQLVRVGIDRPAAQSVGGVATFGAGLDRGSYDVADFADLARIVSGGHPPHVLDVRRHDERRRVGLAGAQHVPIHELTRRMDEVPADRDVWVHCASGYRAALAASLLARAGRRPVLLDDDDQRLTEFGFDLVGELAA